MQRFFTRVTTERSGERGRQPHDPPVPLIVAMIALGMFVGAMIAPADAGEDDASPSPANVSAVE